MIHIVAITQLRLETEGRVYYRRKRSEGKKPLEAVRCLKRRISDAIYRQMQADAQETVGTGPGGHCGASQESSAVDLPPHIDTSDQPLPGPARNRHYARSRALGRATIPSPSQAPVDNRGVPERRWSGTSRNTECEESEVHLAWAEWVPMSFGFRDDLSDECHVSAVAPGFMCKREPDELQAGLRASVVDRHAMRCQ